MHITENQLKLITKIASREAAKAYKEEKKQDEKLRHDRRLKNIKLLLRNYRGFKKHCEDVNLEIDEINDRLAFVTVDSEEFKLESIKRSKERTLIMVRYIDRVMAVYKSISEESSNSEEKRQYISVYEMYISDQKKSAKEIAKGQSVHPRTIYKDIDKASKTLSSLMFGLDGVKFN